ncbi:hypothetical protein [Arthrobacter sp. H5]|uniref:hypothetical protein n=1 Tax=Arthrobacter sp. H5 TaxID=1267973 RepID=UPI0004B75529|nr:hypothetical protein [Arthrobacter sp. H5]
MSRTPPAAQRMAAAALLAAAALALTGCEDFQIGDRPAETTASQSTAAQPTITGSAEPTETRPTLDAAVEPREGWKVFTDPGRQVSFELPDAWTVQEIAEPGEAYEPDSLHYSVRNDRDQVLAELHTGIKPVDTGCGSDDASPYTVIASVPVDVPSTGESEASIEPLFVVRLIQGFKFFSSFGLTDQLGGTDGQACVLTNTVQGPEGIGLYSFGDSVSARALPPNEIGSGTATFDTIVQAQEFFEAAGYVSVRDMILSLTVAQ